MLTRPRSSMVALRYAAAAAPAHTAQPTTTAATLAQNEFLNTPVGRFGDVDFAFRGTRELVRAGELFQQAARPADHPEHFPVERHLEDPPGERRFTDEHDLSRARRNTDGIRSADARCEPLAGRRVAVDRVRARRGRHVDREETQELPVGVEDLDAPVRPIANVDVVAAIDGNRVRQTKLSRRGAALAP